MAILNLNDYNDDKNKLQNSNTTRFRRTVSYTCFRSEIAANQFARIILCSVFCMHSLLNECVSVFFYFQLMYE